MRMASNSSGSGWPRSWLVMFLEYLTVFAVDLSVYPYQKIYVYVTVKWPNVHLGPSYSFLDLVNVYRWLNAQEIITAICVKNNNKKTVLGEWPSFFFLVKIFGQTGLVKPCFINERPSIQQHRTRKFYGDKDAMLKLDLLNAGKERNLLHYCINNYVSAR